MDFLLGAESHDIVYVNGGCMVTYSPQEVVAQRLKIALATFLGEWFLDTSIGIPYFQQILGQKRSKDAIDVIFQTAISALENVEQLVSFSSTFDSRTRSYDLTFSVRTVDGFTTDPITFNLSGATA